MNLELCHIFFWVRKGFSDNITNVCPNLIHMYLSNEMTLKLKNSNKAK